MYVNADLHQKLFKDDNPSVIIIYALMYKKYTVRFNMGTNSCAETYRVCHGFSIMKQNDYFRVNFDHF